MQAGGRAANLTRMAHDMQEMLAEIQEEARLAAPWTGIARISARVLDAMAATPRHLFVPAEEVPRAWANAPLPIGEGQTISQPYIVALMTELVAPAPEDRVLDIGTGSGWQAAILARLAKEVVSVEVRPRLARQARRRLARLGLAHVEVHEGDGWLGWEEKAPYQGIVVAAAAPSVSPHWIAQLAPGGRLVAPIGPPGQTQTLMLITKDSDGRVHERAVLPVAFVPLIRE